MITTDLERRGSDFAGGSGGIAEGEGVTTSSGTVSGGGGAGTCRNGPRWKPPLGADWL